MNDVDISALKGKTLTAITGAEIGSEEIVFIVGGHYEEDRSSLFGAGRLVGEERYRMWHEQDCCEGVDVEEIVGDINDLIGSPLVEAEEVSDYQGPHKESESYTWTFYKLGTAKGFVTIRWFGQSNGYYSETVSFEKMS